MILQSGKGKSLKVSEQEYVFNELVKALSSQHTNHCADHIALCLETASEFKNMMQLPEKERAEFAFSLYDKILDKPKV